MAVPALMSEKDPTLYEASAYADPKAWDALVELARAIVKFADQHDGEGCDYARVDVNRWSTVDGVENRHVCLTLAMPRSFVDAALSRAGVLKQDDGLAKDQEIRFGLIEMD